MNIAIILAGGIGTRLGGNIPKQYQCINGKPIIAYSLEAFQVHPMVEKIIIVAAEEWNESIKKWIKCYHIQKFTDFALAGSSRQQSIVNGMKKAIENGVTDEDYIIIHDAVRPNVSQKIITDCIVNLKEADGVMPVLPVKDTVYLSMDQQTITSLLNRDCIFAGQAPESFRLKKYYAIHENLTEMELKGVRGSSEIAYRNGLKIKLIQGEEQNYKITTVADLNKFKMEMEHI